MKRSFIDDVCSAVLGIFWLGMLSAVVVVFA